MLEELKKVQQKIYRIGTLRLLLFVAGAAGIIYFRSESWGILAGIALVTLLPFLSLMKYHNRLFHRKDYLEKKMEINEQELAALDYDTSSFDDGEAYVDPAHLYTYDLDVFGPHSLFQYINRTCTQPGKHRLALWLGKQPEEKEILTLKQQEKLFSLINKSNVYNVYAPLFTVLLETGLRCGELIGLTWSDVDMTERELSVNHQLIYKDWGDGYCFRISTPKTKAGIRTIPFTDTVHRAFAEQRKINFMLGRHSTEEIDGYSDFIFLAKTGRPLMPSAVNNVIYNVIDAYNREEGRKARKEHRKAELLPKISAHNLRHTACSNMAKQGMNVKVLQYLMGHAHSDVTMDVYNHIASKQDIKEEVERYARVAGN